MKNKFVEGVSNVTRFTNATRSVDARGAQEAGWHLATGMPGFGKSGTVGWYAMQSKAVFIRCKAAYTPHWLLADIAESLNVESKIHSTEKLFKAVLPVLMERYNADGSRLIVDEINHACHNGEVIEILRCLTDGSRTLAGRPDLEPALLRVADGVADRLDRLHGSGNGVQPLAAALAYRTLKAAFAA